MRPIDTSTAKGVDVSPISLESSSSPPPPPDPVENVTIIMEDDVQDSPVPKHPDGELRDSVDINSYLCGKEYPSKE